MAEKENFAIRLDSIEERFEVLKGILETTNLAFAGRFEEITKEIHEIKDDIHALRKGGTGNGRRDNDLDSIEVGNSKIGKVKIYYNRKEELIETVEKDLENARVVAQETLRKMEAEK